MKRSLITLTALYLLYERQRRVERRVRVLEQEWRAAELALADAAAQIEAWNWSYPREEGAV